MTARDTTELWRRYKLDSDPKAREALINQYAHLVKITAGRVVTSLPPNIERDDLVSAGVVGLITAVDQYDLTRHVKFETYAIALIRGAILKMLREEGWVPRSVRERVKNLERTYLQLEMSLGRPATEEEVASTLGIGIDDLHTLLADVDLASLVSLDDVIVSADGNERIHLVDAMDDELVGPLLEVEGDEMRRIPRTTIDRLPDRERLVISLYYFEGLTFKEIGNVLSVSESRVYQLHTQAVLRLRGYSESYAGTSAPYRSLDLECAQILNDAERLIDQVRSNFHDPASRLAYFVDFKEACRRLCDIEPAEDTSQWHRLAAALFASVECLYAEDLSLLQVDCIRYALVMLEDRYPARWTVENARRVLAEAGLQTTGVEDRP